jgi:hypothetical protein
MEPTTPAANIPGVEHTGRLQTKNVFVDTSVHIAAKFVYSGGSFHRLADLAEADLATVYHTEIDGGEIRSNIADAADKAAKSLAGFQREAQGLKAASLASVAALFHPLSADAINDLIHAAYLQFRSRSQSIEITLARTDAADIFRRYFARTAPFEEKKKSEFPDAFIISVLADWCWSNAEMMYVVSRDSGFRDAAAKIGRGRLLPLEGLDEFLDLVVSKEHHALAVAAQQWLRANESTVARAVSEAFIASGFYLEDADGDPEDIEVEELHGSLPLLVEVRESEAIFTIAGDVSFTAALVFEDPDSGIYDKEDDLMLYTKTVRRRVRRTSEFKAEIRVVLASAHVEPEIPSPMLEGEITEIVLNRNEDFAISIDDELVEVLPGEESHPSDSYFDWLTSVQDERAIDNSFDGDPDFDSTPRRRRARPE